MALLHLELCWISLIVMIIFQLDLLKCVGQQVPQKSPIETTDPIAVESSQFFLRELCSSSDSGIYETLKLNNIISAAFQEGIFHENIHLKVSLSSPYFRSGQPTESFEVVVMKHRSDGSNSFAIDRFPDMDDDAVEMFWIQKVERHRAKREQFFEEMLRESTGDQTPERQEDLHNQPVPEQINVAVDVEGQTSTVEERNVEDERQSLHQLMEGLTNKELVRVLEHASGDPLAAQVASNILDRRYNSVSEKFDLESLKSKPISELYAILLDSNQDLQSKQMVEILLRSKIDILTYA